MANRNCPIEDHRRMQRFLMSIPATIEVNNNGGGADLCFQLVSRDVSAGGAFFPTTRPLDVGTRVNIRMLLFDGKSVQANNAKCQVALSGTILRVEAEGIAVCFDKKYKISPMN